MNQTIRPRPGFTMIELVVAISIVILLAGLLLAFMPSLQSQQRAAQGATMLQGYLANAKASAFRNRTPGGLRLLNKNGLVTEFQYIEQPDDFTDQSSAGGNALYTSPAGNAQQMHILGADLWNGASAVEPLLWSVQPGDSIEIMGGSLVHRIWGPAATPSEIVWSNQGSPPASIILLASPPDPFVPSYNVQVQPTPTGGQWSLIVKVTLPSGTFAQGFSPALPPNANRAAVQTGANVALAQALSGLSLPNGMATVGGPDAGPWRIVFSIPAIVQSIQLSANDSLLTYAPAPDPSPKVIANGPTPPQKFPYYRIIRAPRVVGTEQLQMPSNIVVDLTTNTSALFPPQYWNPLPINPLVNDLDILFAPSGAVMTPGLTQDFIGLWVRDTTSTNIYEIGPTILAVHARTGLIAAHPPNDAGSPVDPYKFVRDGRSQ